MMPQYRFSMKHRYIFIWSKGAIKPDTTIYYAWFGSNRRDRELLKWCVRLVFLQDYYFKKDCDEVTEFVHKIAASLFPDKTMPLLAMHTETISPVQLKRFVLQNFAEQQPERCGYSKLRAHLDYKFLTKNYLPYVRK